jgi:predicted metal-binding membrane protein
MGVWISMMAAMMLLGADPALLRFVRANGRAAVAPLFAGSYLALWTLVGLAVYIGCAGQAKADVTTRRETNNDRSQDRNT